MADNVEFNPGDPNYSGSVGYRPQPVGGITKFFMKITGAQNQEQVNKIMLGVAVLFFVLAIVVFVLYH